MVVPRMHRIRLTVTRLRSRGRLQLGPEVRISPGARVSVARGALVQIGAESVLGPDSRVEAAAGRVIIGPGARLAERAIVSASTDVTIGARAVVGDWALVEDGHVGDGAVIGPHAVVGPGATVAAGARIEPYAVVRSPVSES
jgi:carbonic anhydrase/acetyltransferase-like protein (isoleucine patch superfamily)